MKNLNNFYSNKKVLVTGHTGFKGSWLAIWLKELGAIVTGIALDPQTDRDLFLLAGLAHKIKDYRQDIRNLDKIQEILTQEQPEIVFHLAAQALVLPGYENPVDTFVTNIIGTANILEACRHTLSVKQIVIVTTDKVYENKECITGYKETDSLGGYDPYSASKAAAEILTQSYRLSFSQSASQSIATARAGNVIGGGDWSVNRIVPDCIKSLEKNEPIIIRNPESVRPWQHVLEPLSGYLFLASKMAVDPNKYSGAWNFGPEERDLIKVKDIVEAIIKCWGKGHWQYENKNAKPHEAGILRLDITKVKNNLGWRPVLNIERAISMTVDWYKNFASDDIYGICVKQINEFSDLWNSGN
ncbi:MAG: CDP-glucose 4,6-dehydratase [Bacteroidales bacterium]|nr:CDP-glucose 4,6-dehydratase [Bacteroidales bacterium]